MFKSCACQAFPEYWQGKNSWMCLRKSWEQQRKEGSSILTKNSSGSIECHMLCGACSARGEMFKLPKSAVKLSAADGSG